MSGKLPPDVVVPQPLTTAIDLLFSGASKVFAGKHAGFTSLLNFRAVVNFKMMMSLSILALLYLASWL